MRKESKSEEISQIATEEREALEVSIVNLLLLCGSLLLSVYFFHLHAWHVLSHITLNPKYKDERF